ncbi:unnamed protein product, partial [Polarella glacialis]
MALSQFLPGSAAEHRLLTPAQCAGRRPTLSSEELHRECSPWASAIAADSPSAVREMPTMLIEESSYSSPAQSGDDLPPWLAAISLARASAERAARLTTPACVPDGAADGPSAADARKVWQAREAFILERGRSEFDPSQLAPWLTAIAAPSPS